MYKSLKVLKNIVYQDNEMQVSMYEELYERAFTENRNYELVYEFENTSLQFDGNLLSMQFNEQKCLALVLKEESIYVKFAKEQEKRKYEKKLVNTITHELRTPLNGIISMFEVMKKKNRDPEIHDLIRVGLNTSFLLLNLINDILDFAQIEAKQLQVVNALFTLDSIIHECCELVAFQIEKKGLKLEVDISEDVPKRILSDKNRYRQILLNLLSNAIKFTSHGFIQIAISFNHNTFMLYTAIRDTGIGISQEDQAKLFQEFGKLSSSSQMNSQGNKK